MRRVPTLWMTACLATLVAAMACCPVAMGQEAEPQAPAIDAGEEAPPEEEAVVRKQFTRAEVRRICKKYKGQLIAFYGEVFRVEDCERRPIMNNKTIYELQRSGAKIHDVDGDVVAALPEGEPVDRAMTLAAARTCEELDHRYVSFSSVDVYFVEKCKKRIFPDWETYIKHREKRGDKKGEVLALSWLEFSTLETGAPIESIFDDLYDQVLSGEAGVDVIPVDEACEGINGKLVSYYSRLYRIERCRKREIVEPEMYMKRAGPKRLKLKELTSQQWLSLPDGRPIEEPPTKKRG